MGMRAVIYTRQSLDKTRDGAAVARQLEDCRKLAADRGWQVVGEYSDNDTSAYARRRRKDYEAVLQQVRAGEVDVIVAWHLDRLVRRLADLEPLIELTQQAGCTVATVTGDLDLSNDTGRLLGRILSSVAQGEVERKGARQSRAQQQAAAEGRPAGGRRPFGYGVLRPVSEQDPRLVWDACEVNEPEAELVRAAYQSILAGGSLHGVAADWNARGVVTTMGNRWMHSTVRRLLQNPRNVARRTYKGEHVGDAVWPPIVDVDTFDATCALLALPERSTTPGGARRWLLAGLAVCHCHGVPVMTGKSSKGPRTYRCRVKRGGLSRAAEPVDAFIAGGEIDGRARRGLVVDRLSRPDAAVLLAEGAGPDLARLRDRERATGDRLDQLADALADGVLPLEAVRRASDRLRRELETLRGQIAAHTAADVLAPLVDAPDVEAVWAGYDLARRRAVIDCLMVVTLLSPGRGRQRFDPATVRVEWRHKVTEAR